MPDQALPADVGLCGCNARNSLRATRCHSCGNTLPWAKPAPEPKPKAAKPQSAAANPAPKASVSVDSEALALFGVGIVIFFLSLFSPFGFAMYRWFSREESPLANYAAAGALLGIGLFIWTKMDNAVNPTANSVP